MIRIIFIILLVCTITVNANDFEITRLRLNKKYVYHNDSDTYPLSFFKNSALKIEGRVYCTSLERVNVNINGEEFEADFYGTDDEGFTEFDLTYVVGDENIYVITIHAEDASGLLSDFFVYTMHIKENERRNEPVVQKIWIHGQRVLYGKELFLKRALIGKNIDIKGEIEDVSKIEISEIFTAVNGKKRSSKYWCSESNPYVYIFRAPFQITDTKNVYEIEVYAVNKKNRVSKKFVCTLIVE